jgi:hypothetical protein
MRTPVALPPRQPVSSVMFKRRRFKQSLSLKERLISFANDAREKASLMEPSIEKEELLRKARRADTARHLDDWSNSAGLQPPK